MSVYVGFVFLQINCLLIKSNFPCTSILNYDFHFYLQCLKLLSLSIIENNMLKLVQWCKPYICILCVYII